MALQIQAATADEPDPACASQPDCRAAFPGWERQLGRLVRARNAHPVHGAAGGERASVDSRQPSFNSSWTGIPPS
jgi:hypothetical protein